MRPWDCLRRGFDTFASNLPVMMGAWIIILAIQQGIDLLVPDSLILMETIATMLILAPLYAGQQLIALLAVRGEPTSVRDLFAGVPQWGSIAGASILINLGIALGMMLLVVPGILVALMMSFAPIRFLDPARRNRRIGSTTALSESTALTRGVRGTLFGIGLLLAIPALVLVGVAILYVLKLGFPRWAVDVLAILSGTLFLGPVQAASTMVVYDTVTRLPKEKDATQSPDTDPGCAN